MREAMLLLVEEVEKQREQTAQQVTKAAFQGLQGVVQELIVSGNRLVEAQARTEAEYRLTRERLEGISSMVGCRITPSNPNRRPNGSRKFAM